MSNNITEILRKTIRTVPNFPIEGILFRDISPILSDGDLLKKITENFSEIIQTNNLKPDLILGPESRGFIFGSLLAAHLGIGFIPVRKPGKLPFKKYKSSILWNMATNILEMHEDAISAGQRVIIIDDLLATGGTVEACTKLCEQLGGRSDFKFVCYRIRRFRCQRKITSHPLHFID